MPEPEPATDVEAEAEEARRYRRRRSHFHGRTRRVFPVGQHVEDLVQFFELESGVAGFDLVDVCGGDHIGRSVGWDSEKLVMVHLWHTFLLAKLM